MAKEVDKVLKLQIRGGAANPSPPVGPALGAAGVNIMEFCKQFNSRSQDKPGKVLPVVINVYKDKSFEFVIKTPPAAVQLLEAAKKKISTLAMKIEMLVSAKDMLEGMLIKLQDDTIARLLLNKTLDFDAKNKKCICGKNSCKCEGQDG